MSLLACSKLLLLKAVDSACQGIKCLLLDEDTLSMVNSLFTINELINHGVYLFELISSERYGNYKFMSAIVFIRPSQNSIELMLKELKNPNFKSYYINFTTHLTQDWFEKLASADRHDLIKSFTILNIDFYPLSHETVIFNSDLLSTFGNKVNHLSHLEKTAQGLISLIRTLQSKPLILLQNSSELCRNFAKIILPLSEVQGGSSINHFTSSHAKSTCILLILDRRFDPITPLVFPWTYQAMLHELFGIKNNIADLSSVLKIPSDMKKIKLSPLTDKIYNSLMYSDYGFITREMSKLARKHKETSSITEKVSSTQDIREIVKNCPKILKQSTNRNEHILLVSELSVMIEEKKLMEISQLEQDVVCAYSPEIHLKKLRELFSKKDQIHPKQAMKLLALFSVRYSNIKKNSKFSNLLKQFNHLPNFNTTLQNFQIFADEKYLLKPRNGMLQGLETFTKKLIRPEENDNVFLRHVPDLDSIIEDVSKNKLNIHSFSQIDDKLSISNITEHTIPNAKTVVVMVLGGITYSESLIIHRFNSDHERNMGRKFYLASDRVLNSQSLLNDISGFV